MSEAPRLAIRGKRVLVVDDERPVAELIAANLEPFEVRTEIATSGEEAIARLREGGFDALTLDLKMDGMSGLDLLRELRDDAELRRTPVVVVSILSEHEALFGEWKVHQADRRRGAGRRARLGGARRTHARPGGRPVGRALPRSSRRWCAWGSTTSGSPAGPRPPRRASGGGSRSRWWTRACATPRTPCGRSTCAGRRIGQAVLVFSTTGEGDEGLARMGARAVPIEQAAEAVMQTLSQEPPLPISGTDR